MATSDTELISEVRNLTGYTNTNTFSDSDVEGVIKVAKEEIRSYLGDPNFTFYQTSPEDTHDADRALFWFSCIGLKVRAGEIGAADLTLDSLEKSQSNGQYNFWFNQLWSRLHSATMRDYGGAASTQITRADDRTYAYNEPDLGGE